MAYGVQYYVILLLLFLHCAVNVKMAVHFLSLILYNAIYTCIRLHSEKETFNQGKIILYMD